MTLWRRIERIEAETRRQAEADTRAQWLIVKLGDTGRTEVYDLRDGGMRLVDNEQEAKGVIEGTT